MEIILKQDVDSLGHKNDIVKVRPGYANNFLIPSGFAILATISAKKMVAEDIRQQSHKEAKLRDEALALVAKLEAAEINLTVKVSENNKIFGSVTSMQVVDVLTSKGFSIEKKNIIVDSVKELGSYEAIVKVYKDIKATVKFAVVAEA